MNHPYYFCRLHRYDGQLLYLLVAKLGLFCLAFAFILCSAALYTFQVNGWFDYQTLLENKVVELKYAEPVQAAVYAFVLQIAVISIFIPAPWTLLARIGGRLKGAYTGFGSASAYHRTRLLLDTPLGELIFDSVSKTRQMLMVTMADRKVYIGHVDSLGEPSENESPQSTFSFIPNFSGYRDKDTLELKLTTTYPERDRIRIVLREENVLTATPWNALHWDAFTEEKIAKGTKADRNSLRRQLKIDKTA
jgi:hypothetical protein